MKKNIMKKIIKSYLLVSVLLTDFVTYAQLPGDGTGGGGLEGDDPPPAPIDSRLIILLILGFIFAFYSLKQKREKI
jgi:hypothetical protein